MTFRPTIAHLRACACGVLLAVGAVLLRRPDLLVLATPLLVIAVWSTWLRPTDDPVIAERLGHATIREGEATTWHIDIEGGSEDVAAVLTAPTWSTLEPAMGAVCAEVDDGRASLAVTVRSTRWGRRVVGPAHVASTSAWAAFRFTLAGALPRTLTTLPMPSVFDSAAPPVHTAGLVGLARSSRPGDGREFANVRPFQVGDRLRRIHWPRSLRTGTLHVTSTWSDQDSHVVIVVDALNDLGDSGGIDGAASSLDVSVRAAGAIAEHHLHRGDRVALHVVGSRGVTRVPVATGRAHLRRILDTLATIEPATDLHDRALMHLALPAGALVVMLSPLVSPVALQRAYTLAMRGLTVVVVDTLPPDIVEDDAQDPFLGLAWRIRLLERHRELRHIQQVGVPVVQWRGPGSLDQVLRDLHRALVQAAAGALMAGRASAVLGRVTSMGRGQMALRLVVLVMPLLATCVTFVASSNWVTWLLVLVLAGAVECAVHGESNLGVGIIVLIAVHWIATVDDQTTPWTFVVASAIAVFHTAMAASGVAAPSARWSSPMRARWLLRLAIVLALTLVAWVLEVVVADADQSGNAVVLGAALAALTVTGLVLRARALHPSWPSRRNI